MPKCVWHLCQNQALKRFCSVRCKNKFSVDKRRKNVKQLAIAYKGGACEGCGYNRCAQALHFHHLDPTEKDFNIGMGGHTRSWSRVKAELDKCALLCGNCHAEVHDGMRILAPGRGIEPLTG